MKPPDAAAPPEGGTVQKVPGHQDHPQGTRWVRLDQGSCGTCIYAIVADSWLRWANDHELRLSGRLRRRGKAYDEPWFDANGDPFEDEWPVAS